ncbi:hypothetical protein Poli38472_005823 [Pythium oligandrum]|uniref:Trafficking protein particle complex subunit n=1 Tax=Pythium oligandrum TaxID=41045 RepID=A0A8K1FLK7_PYTOL|nr:hypothetical protein Poli38472_005823 [Pythium oligandrum]|eukprot:TMW68355.1 hypothetical protein Poli38472_005823 [Pythium oligandrum]
MLHSLYIINKSGGLIYQQDLSHAAPKLSSNDHLRLGSTFHSMHAIAVLAAPVNSGGIESLETDTFRLQCYQTPTGIKFFITSALGTPDLDVALRTIYELYVDYVLKNPFYELEMPIRCSLFNAGLRTYVDKFNADSLRRRPQGNDSF